MVQIKQVIGREILDSRGNQTVAIRVMLEGGVEAEAMVPSGASTEQLSFAMAISTPPRKWCAYSCRACKSVLAEAVVGMEETDQKAVDAAMLTLDGTENKGGFGANAILGVSLAVARAELLPRVYCFMNISTISLRPTRSLRFPCRCSMC